MDTATVLKASTDEPESRNQLGCQTVRRFVPADSSTSRGALVPLRVG